MKPETIVLIVDATVWVLLTSFVVAKYKDHDDFAIMISLSCFMGWAWPLIFIAGPIAGLIFGLSKLIGLFISK